MNAIFAEIFPLLWLHKRMSSWYYKYVFNKVTLYDWDDNIKDIFTLPLYLPCNIPDSIGYSTTYLMCKVDNVFVERSTIDFDAELTH